MTEKVKIKEFPVKGTDIIIKTASIDVCMKLKVYKELELLAIDQNLTVNNLLNGLPEFYLNLRKHCLSDMKGLFTKTEVLSLLNFEVATFEEGCCGSILSLLNAFDESDDEVRDCFSENSKHSELKRKIESLTLPQRWIFEHELYAFTYHPHREKFADNIDDFCTL